MSLGRSRSHGHGNARELGCQGTVGLVCLMDRARSRLASCRDRALNLQPRQGMTGGLVGVVHGPAAANVTVRVRGGYPQQAASTIWRRSFSPVQSGIILRLLQVSSKSCKKNIWIKSKFAAKFLYVLCRIYCFSVYNELIYFLPSSLPIYPRLYLSLCSTYILGLSLHRETKSSRILSFEAQHNHLATDAGYLTWNPICYNPTTRERLGAYLKINERIQSANALDSRNTPAYSCLPTSSTTPQQGLPSHPAAP